MTNIKYCKYSLRYTVSIKEIINGSNMLASNDAVLIHTQTQHRETE